MWLSLFFMEAVKMLNYENDVKKKKAREERMRKPLHKELNYDSICMWFDDAWELCSEVAYANDDYENLVDALDGDDEEAYEFRMCFGNLEADFDRFAEQLRDEQISKYFDLFLAAESDDELCGWDSYDEDYLPIDTYLIKYAREDIREKLKRLTKDEMITVAGQCFGIVLSYLSIRTRFDSLKSTMDILREKNSVVLKAVRDIQRLYDDAWKKYLDYPYGRDEEFMKREFWKEFDKVTAYLPQEAFIA